jgi:hypothetical protein
VVSRLRTFLGQVGWKGKNAFLGAFRPLGSRVWRSSRSPVGGAVSERSGGGLYGADPTVASESRGVSVPDSVCSSSDGYPDMYADLRGTTSRLRKGNCTQRIGKIGKMGRWLRS